MLVADADDPLIFQSTLLREERHQRDKAKAQLEKISIHAPARGAT